MEVYDENQSSSNHSLPKKRINSMEISFRLEPETDISSAEGKSKLEGYVRQYCHEKGYRYLTHTVEETEVEIDEGHRERY